MADTPKVGVAQDGDSFTGLCECSFRTSGWPSSEIAEDRIRQHRNEHETGELMEPLSKFRVRHELVSAGNKAVFGSGVKVLDENDTETTDTESTDGIDGEVE